MNVIDAVVVCYSHLPFVSHAEAIKEISSRCIMAQGGGFRFRVCNGRFSLIRAKWEMGDDEK